ncbi:MAG TPA: transglutaminase [Clostridia bacterium]|nr:transglutaminase [Clostridia bacterium]
MRKNVFWLLLIAVIFAVFLNFDSKNLVTAFKEKISLAENKFINSKSVTEFLSNLQAALENRIIWDNGRLIIDFRSKTTTDEIPPLKNSLQDTSFDKLTSVNSEKDLYLVIKHALSKTEGEVTFIATPSFYESIGSNYTSEEVIKRISDTAKLVLSQHPDLGYTDKWTVSVVSYNTGLSKITISFNYFYSREEIEQMKNETESKAKEIISKIITPGMNELQKAKAIHDYIVKHTKYDYKNYINNTIPIESFTAYGVLIKGVGVCQGYTAAFNLLANMAGLESIGVSGTGIRNGKAVPHAWSMVKINGEIRYIDVTWDDPVPDRGDKVMYTYFNLTEKQIEKDHKWDKEKFSERYFDYK